MAKFAINASGAILLPSLVQVSESISGSVVPLAMFILSVVDLSYFWKQIQTWSEVLPLNLNE